MDILNSLAAQLNIDLFVLLLLIIWSFIWKGVALWKSARNGAKGWFVVLFVLNTLGILPILYIYAFAEKKKEVDHT